MTLYFSKEAWEDYLYWKENDKKMLKRANLLIKDALRNPFQGLGKPEPLRNDLSGFWSRRISQEHQLIYKVSDEGNLYILKCRYHY